jgi:hypothetical protein
MGTDPWISVSVEGRLVFLKSELKIADAQMRSPMLCVQPPR